MSRALATLAVVAVGLALGGCQSPRATFEAAIKGDPAKPYLGMTKDQVIACAGNPSGRYGTTSGEMLVYHYSGAGPVPSAPPAKPDKKSNNPFAKSKSEKTWDCSASLSFEGDRLTRVTFAPREVVSPYETKKDRKTGQKVSVTPPAPCNFSLPNCRGR
jgi:hypothetical protein